MSSKEKFTRRQFLKTSAIAVSDRYCRRRCNWLFPVPCCGRSSEKMEYGS